MKHRNRILLAALALAPLVACSQGVGVETILEKAEAATGGSEPPRAVSLQVEGTWASPKMGFPPMPYTAEYVVDFEGNRAYWKIQPPMMEPMVMAYDGQTAWGSWMAPAARYSGWMQDMVAESVAEAQLMLAPGSADAQAFTLVSDEPQGDPPAWELDYAPASGGEWKVGIDETGFVVRLEHVYRFMDGEPMDGRWMRSEPKAFGERTVTTGVRYEGTRDGEVIERMEERIVDVTWNPELPEDLFAFGGPGIDLEEIGTKTVPPSTVVSTSYVGPYESIAPAIERLMDGVMAAGLMPAGPIHGTYLNDPGKVAADELETKLSVPVMVAGEPPALGEDLTLEQWPEMKVAFAWHRGEHAGEGEAHQRLMTWVGKQKKRPAGPPRALWYHDPEVTVTEDQITEVQVPLR